MNYQTSNAGRDVTAHIGALELGAIHSFDDSALESTVQAGPSTMPPACRRTFIDDGELETTIQVGPGPSGLTRFPTCMPRIDDSDLEATVHAGPSTHLRRSTVCLNIDDRALEESVVSMGPPPAPTMNLQCLTRVSCGRIDNGALEEAIQAGPNAQVTLLRNSRRGCEFVEVNDGALEASVLSMGPMRTIDPRDPRCRTRIDDSALELSAGLSMNPTQVSCLPLPTMRTTGCRIDDEVLEAAVQAGPQRPTAIRLPGGGCLPGADDSALEATVQAGPSTMPPACRFHIDDSALEQAGAYIEAGPPPTSVRFPYGGCNTR